jgi:hypothetical protein
MKLVSLLTLLTFSFNVTAIDIVPLKKGDPAPSDGYFVSPVDMKQFRQINEEKKLLEEKEYTYKQLALTNEQQIDIYKRSSDFYQGEYSKEHYIGNLKGIGGFVLGSVLTFGATYVAIKAGKW